MMVMMMMMVMVEVKAVMEGTVTAMICDGAREEGVVLETRTEHQHHHHHHHHHRHHCWFGFVIAWLQFLR